MNLKYEKISTPKYYHNYVWFLESYLKALGWETVQCAISSLKMFNKENDMTFSLFGSSFDSYKFINLTKDYETQEIGHCLSISNETTTQGLLNIFEHYKKMNRREIQKYQLLTPWQDQVFYKNIIRC